MKYGEGRRVAFLVQGLFEVSDSIGFDCVYQYQRVRDCSNSHADVRIFAERFVQANHPDVFIEDITSFYDWTSENADVLIIYHYCGQWREIDDYLTNRDMPSIVRWHNNTPPWFYMSSGVSNAVHTISGYSNILDLIDCKNIYFWVNSDFTRRQLLALGGQVERVSTVFPASRYLDRTPEGKNSKRDVAQADDGIDLLFVGRIVQHKGYKGLILVARRVAEVTGSSVRLHLPGRIDVAMRKELGEFANEHHVDARLYGEVSEAELARLYHLAHVFVCLSEHEGFGLPVFEAMACGLPVVAWANTAFSDLLVGHPFGFKEYNINAFVAAVVSLGDSTIRDRVLEIQTEILKKYDHDIISDQLKQGLENLSKGSSYDLLLQGLTPHLRREEILSGELVNAAISSRNITVGPIVHDSGSNLYSQYDLDIYREFLNKRSEERRVLLSPVGPDPHVLFHSSEFSRNAGSADERGVCFSLDTKHSGHILFGPYIHFPAGRYSAEFLFEVTGVTEVSLAADVTADGKCIAEGTLWVRAGGAKVVNDVAFTIHEDDMVVEFRIALKEKSPATLQFNGVKVRQK